VEEELTPRTPEETDLVGLCAALNAHGARYIVVGGMAVLLHGFLRATEDIDLLLETSRDNQNRIRQALEILPDKAIREMAEGDLDEYGVVRVGDEITVDLMMSACGITYEQAKEDIEHAVINGVTIPFASAKLLLRMKQTYREKDIPDRIFLQEKLLRESAKQ
jgi:hypothetical protein